MTQEPNNEENVVEESKTRSITEELEVAGGQLVERVQEVIKQGNVRKIIIKNADDKVLLETSLTVGAVAGGALMLIPGGLPLAVLGSIAAAVAKVKIEVVRELKDGEVLDATDKKKVEIAVEDEE